MESPKKPHVVREPEPQILLVDGHYFLHRCLHVEELNSLQTSAAVKTGGVFGVLASIRDALVRFPTAYKCVVAWDFGRSKRREEILPEYKANRAPKPGEEEIHAAHKALLVSQLRMLKEVLPCVGVRQAELSGKEGDDVLGWMARNIPLPKVVVTDDKDLLQVVDQTTSVFRPRFAKLVTLENFREETGVPKPLFLLKKAIAGDKSDNIPGVPSVGETTVDRVMDEVTAIFERNPTTLSSMLSEACNTKAAEDSRNRKKYLALLGNLETVKRNLSIVDVKREEFSSDEELVLRQAVDGEWTGFNEEATVAAFTKLEFMSKLSLWDFYSAPFRVLR